MTDRDPWIHRSLGMRCNSCMYWVEKVARNKGPEPDKRELNLLGRCRRHAPALGGFPATFTQDWCGDHKLDENTV